ncbi:MAG: Gp49 family protein [Neptuniibacter sp.]
MSDKEIESLIQEKGLNAPRVTFEEIEELMSHVTYYVHQIPDTTTITVTAFDKNGFSLATEISACASPENFDYELGKKIAIEKCEKVAQDTLWVLEGYRLKRNLEA